MNKWMTEAASLMRQRAPDLTESHAIDIAKDLWKAWPSNTPAIAVAKFCRELPVDWKAARGKRWRRTEAPRGITW